MNSLPDVLAYTYPRFSKGFSQAGIDAHRFSLPLGWTGPNTFDPREADQLLDEWSAESPDSIWFPMLWIDGPDTKWWEGLHPGECAVMRCRATGGIASEAAGVPRRLGTAGGHEAGTTLFDHNHQRPPCLHSFASSVWLDDACAALQRALEHFHTRHSSRFRAFYLCAGLSHEWFGWGNYSDEVLFDYSTPMEAWFRNWLQLRYPTLESLNDSWSSGFQSWGDIMPPPPSRRPSRESAPFRRSPEDQAATDFDRAQADAHAHCLIRLCRAAKMKSPARFGAFYGYWWTQSDTPAPGRNGHLALQKVLEAPEVDFLASPLDYVNRGADGASASQSLPDSAIIHGKQFINSADIRLQKGAHPEWQPFVDSPDSVADGIEWMKKDFGFSMAHGLTHSWVDLFGGAFQHAGHRQALADLQHIASEHPSRHLPTISQALLVIDEAGLAAMTPGHAAWTVLFPANRQWHLSRSGFPWACVTLRDFLALDWPTTRLVNFLVCDVTSAEVVERIRSKLSSLGATAIWNYPNPAARQCGLLEHLTGFKLELRHRAPRAWECQSSMDGTHFGPSHIGSRATSRMRYYPDESSLASLPCLAFKNLPNGKVLASWSEDNSPSVVVTTAPGFRSVMNTGLLLTEEILSMLALDAGVHRYTPPGPVVHANPRFACVWTRDTPAEFTAPAGMIAAPLWPQDSKASSSKLPLEARKCALLALDAFP